MAFVFTISEPKSLIYLISFKETSLLFVERYLNCAEDGLDLIGSVFVIGMLRDIAG